MSHVEENCIQDSFHWRYCITFGGRYFNDGKIEKMEEDLGYSKDHQTLVCSCNTYSYTKGICVENNDITLFTSHLHTNIYFIFTAF